MTVIQEDTEFVSGDIALGATKKEKRQEKSFCLERLGEAFTQPTTTSIACIMASSSSSGAEGPPPPPNYWKTAASLASLDIEELDAGMALGDNLADVVQNLCGRGLPPPGLGGRARVPERAVDPPAVRMAKPTADGRRRVFGRRYENRAKSFKSLTPSTVDELVTKAGSALASFYGEHASTFFDGASNVSMRMEVASVLSTQATTNSNSEAAGINLAIMFPDATRLGEPDWEAINRAAPEQLHDVVRKAGRWREITKNLQLMLSTYTENQMEAIRSMDATAARNALQQLRGMGSGAKTVDCMLLYALRLVAFPRDVHVGRKARRMGWLKSAGSSPEDEFYGWTTGCASTAKEEQQIRRALDAWTAGLARSSAEYELKYKLILKLHVLMAVVDFLCTAQKPNCRVCPMRSAGLCQFGCLLHGRVKRTRDGELEYEGLQDEQDGALFGDDDDDDDDE